MNTLHLVANVSGEIKSGVTHNIFPRFSLLNSNPFRRFSGHSFLQEGFTTSLQGSELDDRTVFLSVRSQVQPTAIVWRLPASILVLPFRSSQPPPSTSPLSPWVPAFQQWIDLIRDLDERTLLIFVMIFHACNILALDTASVSDFADGPFLCCDVV